MDFSPLNVTILFDGESTDVQSVFGIRNDSIIEGDEVFTITIQPSPEYNVGSLSTATVRILDDESKFCNLQIPLPIIML